MVSFTFVYLLVFFLSATMTCLAHAAVCFSLLFGFDYRVKERVLWFQPLNVFYYRMFWRVQHWRDAGESADFYIRVAISFVLLFTTGNAVTWLLSRMLQHCWNTLLKLKPPQIVLPSFDLKCCTRCLFRCIVELQIQFLKVAPKTL